MGVHHLSWWNWLDVVDQARVQCSKAGSSQQFKQTNNLITVTKLSSSSPGVEAKMWSQIVCICSKETGCCSVVIVIKPFQKIVCNQQPWATPQCNIGWWLVAILQGFVLMAGPLGLLERHSAIEPVREGLAFLILIRTCVGCYSSSLNLQLLLYLSWLMAQHSAMKITWVWIFLVLLLF